MPIFEYGLRSSRLQTLRANSPSQATGSEDHLLFKIGGGSRHGDWAIHQSVFLWCSTLLSHHQLLRTIRERPEAYQACFSNYYHRYYYRYCTYRYFDDLASMITTTSSEHLLKHTERVGHPVHERLNIIFIDPEYINEPMPHDHKLTDRELKNFPIQLRQSITTLYLRENED